MLALSEQPDTQGYRQDLGDEVSDNKYWVVMATIIVAKGDGWENGIAVPAFLLSSALHPTLKTGADFAAEARRIMDPMKARDMRIGILGPDDKYYCYYTFEARLSQ